MTSPHLTDIQRLQLIREIYAYDREHRHVSGWAAIFRYEEEVTRRLGLSKEQLEEALRTRLK